MAAMTSDRLQQEQLGELAGWAAGLIGQGAPRELDLTPGAWAEVRYPERPAVTATGGVAGVHEVELVIHVLAGEPPAGFDEISGVLGEELDRDPTLGGRVLSAEPGEDAVAVSEGQGSAVVIPLRIVPRKGAGD